MRSFVQTAGAAHLRLGRAEGRVVWGRCHWERKQSDELLQSPPRRKVGTRRGSLVSSLPYGVCGDTGNAGVGDRGSLPFLVGEKILPSTPSRSWGYAAIAV